MVALIHVCIALSSMISVTVTAIIPSRLRLYVSYGLIALTLGSGTYLVVSTHSPLLQACKTGLVYLLVASAGMALAHYREAHRSDTSS